MPDVGVAPFYDVCIAFAVNIASVFSPKDHIKICRAAIGVIISCPRRPIDHGLYVFGANGVIHLERHNLARLTAYHRHDIDIYAVFMPFSGVRKPENLI